MQILDNFIILLLPVLAFIAGLKISDRYHTQSEQEKRYYLQKQYMRLQTKSDADDPCQPYIPWEEEHYTPLKNIDLNAGDTDGDNVLGEDFTQRLKENGRATKQFRKADITA